MHFKDVVHILSIIVVLSGVAMLPSAFYALIDAEPYLQSWLTWIVLTIAFGGMLFRYTHHKKTIAYKEGFAVVALSWLLMAAIGSAPYVFTGVLPNLADAFFESMSGFTTTGATVITDLQVVPRSILFWRSFTHWLGGMGVIVLSLLILPLLGVGNMQLFRAESSVPSHDRLTPKIASTAKVLWQIYTLLTILQVVLLYLGGMNLFDSLCHAFGTLATGGFSTKNASLGAYNSPYFEAVTMVFMVLAGVSFSLHFRFLKGDFKSYLRNSEFQLYVLLLTIVMACVVFDLHRNVYGQFFEALRYGTFQVISIMTTTGYCTADFDTWPVFSKFLLLLLMWVGGCAGSTAGGMKCLRVLLLWRYAARELRRLLFPHAVFQVKLKKEAIPKEVISSVLSFYILSVAIFVLATLMMSWMIPDLVTAVTSVVATLWNIGPGLAGVGATENYAFIPDFGKIVLSLCMVIGRLEVFTIILLFSPDLWKK